MCQRSAKPGMTLSRRAPNAMALPFFVNGSLLSQINPSRRSTHSAWTGTTRLPVKTDVSSKLGRPCAAQQRGSRQYSPGGGHMCDGGIPARERRSFRVSSRDRHSGAESFCLGRYLFESIGVNDDVRDAGHGVMRASNTPAELRHGCDLKWIKSGNHSARGMRRFFLTSRWNCS